MIAIISIIYKEPDPTSYERVVVKVGNILKEFNSGAPQEDYLNAITWARNQTDCDCVMGSSTIDNFIIDGGNIFE